ncbi:hypothetical protein C4588_00360 [Candidatus Parcubacteria bacterium]|nr:MAG: hypothetical protein C4588_00360 [Candidatus Parcubacteria bacterium]
MLRSPSYFSKPRAKKREQNIIYQGFPLGENTSVPAMLLKPQELAECIDFKFNPGGQLETRQPVTRYTSTGGAATAGIVDIQTCSLGGTPYEIVGYGSVAAGYDIGYISAGKAVTKIDDVEGEPRITPYNDCAIISDGSYLKYADDLTEVKMAYDAGTGGTFFDNYNGDVDGTIAITTAGVGCTFTTPAWDAGYTIPATQVYFEVQATTAGAATCQVDIVTTAGTTVATATYTDEIPTTAADILNISYPSVTAELEPSTKYYCLLKGANVNLSYTTVSSGGKLVTAGGATPDTAKTPIMRVHPGLPPKSSWTVVSGRRLWVYDPTKPGQLSFGNLTHLDFSTVNGGGYVGVVDQDSNSFKVGAAQDLYGELYVYGTQDQPYVCKLTGATPADYALPLLFQRIWGTQDTLKNVGSDIWSASSDGIDALTGVQEYGDLRTYSLSDPVKDRFGNWTSAAIAGYNPEFGQYLLYMPGYSYTTVFHTKQAVRDQAGQLRYPSSRYALPIVPSCFSYTGAGFLIGCADGHIYHFDSTEYKDLGTDQIYPSFKTNRVDMPGRSVDLVKIQFMGTSRGGTQFSFDIYKNGNESTSVKTWTVTFPMSDNLTVDELIMDVDDMLFGIDPTQTPLYFDINVNITSLQLKVSNLIICGYPVYFDGLVLTYRVLED